jgi:DNA-binding GntR family transcriptional regulator
MRRPADREAQGLDALDTGLEQVDAAGGFERTAARDLVHRAIQFDIVRGNIAPGAVIAVQDVADRFRVSRMPVREAVEKLVSDGLARRAINGRVVVAGLSVKEAMDLYAVRIELEELALRAAEPHMDSGGLARLRDALQGMHAGSADPVRSTVEGGRAFHESIIQSAGNPILKSILGTLGLRIDRYRYLSTKHGQGRSEAAKEEHDAVYAALAAGEWRTARRAWHDHLVGAREAALGAIVKLGYGDERPESSATVV